MLTVYYFVSPCAFPPVRLSVRSHFVHLLSAPVLLYVIHNVPFAVYFRLPMHSVGAKWPLQITLSVRMSVCMYVCMHLCPNVWYYMRSSYRFSEKLFSFFFSNEDRSNSFGLIGFIFFIQEKFWMTFHVNHSLQWREKGCRKYLMDAWSERSVVTEMLATKTKARYKIEMILGCEQVPHTCYRYT